MPAYVNTQQIDAQVLAALQAEAENVTKGMVAAAAKESPQKDLFDMSKCWLACVHVVCVWEHLSRRACWNITRTFALHSW